MVRRTRDCCDAPLNDRIVEPPHERQVATGAEQSQSRHGSPGGSRRLTLALDLGPISPSLRRTAMAPHGAEFVFPIAGFCAIFVLHSFGATGDGTGTEQGPATPSSQRVVVKCAQSWPPLQSYGAMEKSPQASEIAQNRDGDLHRRALGAFVGAVADRASRARRARLQSAVCPAGTHNAKRSPPGS